MNDLLFGILSLNDALLIVLLLDKVLWHIRTQNRDTAFFEAQKETMALLLQCMGKLAAEDQNTEE